MLHTKTKAFLYTSVPNLINALLKECAQIPMETQNLMNLLKSVRAKSGLHIQVYVSECNLITVPVSVMLRRLSNYILV